MKEKYIGFSLALLSMVGLGISNFLYKKSTSEIGPVNTTFFYYFFSIIIALAVWSVFREKDRELLIGLHWPALISIVLFTSVLAFTYAVKYINVSIGSTVRSLSFLVTVVLAVIFYKEHLSLKDYAAVTCSAIAVILFSVE